MSSLPSSQDRSDQDASLAHSSGNGSGNGHANRFRNDWPADALKGARVLLADDDPVMREYAHALLIDHGVQVRIAKDGLEAWESIQGDPPDIALLDLIMPRMTGIEVIEFIRADERVRTLPVIMISGQTSEDSKIDGFAAGADDFLIKPYSERELMARIGGQLALSRMRNEALQRERGLRAEADQLNEIALRLTSELDLQSLVQKVTDVGTSLTGAMYGAFFYTLIDEKGEQFQLFTVSGADKSEFEKLGMPRSTEIFGPTFRGESNVRLDDVTRDPRFGNNPPHFGLPDGHFPIRSYMAVPVVAPSTEVIGGLFLGHPEPAVFDRRAERFAAGIAAQAAVAIDNARLYARARQEIEERQRAESELRESQQQYKDLVQRLPLAMYTCDVEGRLMLYNEAAVALWGRRPEPGDRWCGSFKMLTLDGELLPMDECPMAITTREGRPVSGQELIVETPHGERRHVLPYPMPLKNSAGEIVGAVNLVLDITDRKLAEESRALMAAIVESTSDAIISMTLDGTITSWNSGAQELYGFTAREALGRKIDIVIPPERRAEESAIFDRIWSGDRIGHLETMRLAKDGRCMDVSLTLSPVEDSSGRLIGISTIARDITARNRMERALERSEQQLRLVIDALPAVVTYVDRDQRYRFFNKQLEEWFHLDPALVEGRSMREVNGLVAYEQIRPYVERVLAGETVRFETQMPDREGNPGTVEVTYVPDVRSDGYIEGFIGLLNDVSTRKRFEHEIKRLNQDLTARVQELETLLDTTPVGVFIAHDPECKVITTNRAGAAMLRAAGPQVNVSKSGDLSHELKFRVLRDGVEVPAPDLPMQRCARLGVEISSESYTHEFDDGECIHTLISATPLRDIDGKPRGCIATMVDVTENLRAQQAMRESEARFARFMQHLPGLAWIKDATGHYIFVNSAAEAAFGRSRSELYGKRDDDIFDPETAEHFKRNDIQALNTGAGVETVETLEQSDGLHHSIVSKFAIPDPVGGPPLVGGMAIDITDRVAAERLLRDSEEKFRSLAMNAPAAIYIKDMDGCYRMANPLACAALGRREVVGLTDYDLMPRDRADKLREHDLRVIVTGQPIESEEIFEAGGIAREFLSVKFPLVQSDGRSTGVCGVSVEITARKRAERVLRHTMERMKLLAGVSEQLLSANDPLQVVNQLCTDVAEFLKCDYFAVRTFDESTEQLVARAVRGVSDSMIELVRSVNSIGSVSGAVLREGKPRIAAQIQQSSEPEFARVRELGLHAYTCHPLHVAGRTIGTLSFGSKVRQRFSTEDVEVMKSVADQVAIAMDRLAARQALIDMNVNLERRVRERTVELLQQRQQLQRLAAQLTTAEQRERKRLASLLHDDLQQLLVSAKMHMATAQRKKEDPDELLATCERVQELIDDSIDAARDMSRQLRPPVLYEDGLVPALRWLASEMHRIHGLTIEVSADDAAEPTDDDQRAFLFECVRELLLNIVKHAGVDRAKIEARCDGSGKLQLIVRDQGRGFAPDAFAEHEGGFGLFSIRERLASIGGRFTIDSNPGQGTTTVLEAPLIEADIYYDRPMPEPDHPHFAHARPRFRTRGTRVLVVDDHVLVREGIATMIAENPDFCVVAQASDGIEAIRAVQSYDPEIVLMDLNMPKMNGIEATRIIRRQWPHVAIVGLSVQEDDITANSVIEAGASVFLSKASTPDQIVSAMRSLITDPAF